MNRLSSSNPYPDHWPIIARTAKNAANWTCQDCHQSLWANVNISLGVHHKDWNPQNNHPSNLRVLCSPCHLRRQALDLRNHLITLHQIAQMEAGQLPLPLPTPVKLPFVLA